MQKNSLIVLLIALFITPLSIFTHLNDLKAQQVQQRNICGMTEQEARMVYNTMIEQRERYPVVAPMRAVAYVPVWFHLVANSDGTGRVSMIKILEMLCELNRLYSVNNVDLQFYIKGINNIDNTSLYTGPRSFGGGATIRGSKKADGLNVFFVGNANDPAQPNATVLGYYTPTDDLLIMINSQASIGGAITMAHEIGHFFSLSHPFLGWETCPFQPTSAVPCAPATVSCFGSGVYTVENAARTGADANCSTAGDGLCDTPPDYNCGFGYNSCNYVALTCDPKGVKIDPDEKNIMGYFIGCETSFTPMQIAAIQSNYLNQSSRANLRAGNVAPTAATLTTPNLTSPVGGATTTYYNNFTLSWEAVPNATGYVVEISKTATFLDSRIYIATTNTLNVNNINTPGYFTAAGQTYFWRVKAYNNYLACANVSARQAFIAGSVTAAHDIAGVTSFEVSPNPLSKSQPLQLNLTSDKAFDAQVKLYNIAGKLLQSEQRHFEAGFSVQSLNINDLSSGLYFLSLESEKGVLNKKVVISH